MKALSAGKIDVLLSTYNGERYVDEAMRSILSQTEEDFRLYVLDDCSKDRTWEIISSYSDGRLTIGRNERNQGLFPNLNKLVALGSSPAVKLMGQDDVLLPNCLDAGLTFLEEQPGVGCFWCYNYDMNERGETKVYVLTTHTTAVLTSDEADMDTLRWGCLSANIANLFLRRDALQAVGPFREDLISADFDLIVRVQHQFNIARFCTPLVKVRGHDRQWSRDVTWLPNQVAGNVEVYRRILDRAVRQRGTISPEAATNALVARLARNEVNWIMRHFLARRDPRAALASLTQIAKLVPRRAVLMAWLRIWGQTYGMRVARRVGQWARPAPRSAH